MDKYPVLEGKQAAGELTVTPEALYTVFDVSCPGREGFSAPCATSLRDALPRCSLRPRS